MLVDVKTDGHTWLGLVGREARGGGGGVGGGGGGRGGFSSRQVERGQGHRSFARSDAAEGRCTGRRLVFGAGLNRTLAPS